MHPVKNKNKKKTVYPAYTKINIVRGTVIYNAHIKFEDNRKYHLDIGILFTISLPGL